MGRALTVFTCIFLAIGGFLFGFDSGIIGSTISQPYFIAYFDTPSASQAGGIVSVFAGGAVIGALSLMFLGDRLGRKKTVFVGATISTIGCAMQAGATKLGVLIAGRAIAGIAVGILSSTVPVYCSEIAEARLRGALAGQLQFMLSWGFFAAQWIGYGSTLVDSDFQWRFPLAFQLVPSITLMIGIWFLQESPRFLVEKDRHDEAKAVLRKLRSGADEETIELEFREIRDVIAADRANLTITWTTIFTKASWRRRLLLGAGVQAFCQLSGINVINYFGPRIYALLGIGNTEALKIIGINGTLGIVENAIMLYLLDRVGRKWPLVVSAGGCGATLLVTATMARFLDESNTNMLRAMVSMNFIFQLFFQPTGTISWVYQSEIFPTEIRAQGNSLSTVTNWILNIIIGQASPTALDAVGFRYFYAFMVFNIVGCLCYISLYPETKGKTLEQMDEVFHDQIIAHALQDPEGAEAGYKQASTVEVVESGKS